MRRWFVPLFLAASVFAFLWWHYSYRLFAPGGQTPSVHTSDVVQARTASNMVAPPNLEQPIEAQPNTPSTLAGATATPKYTPPAPAQVVPLATERDGIAPATALENMRTTIRQYGAMFGGNPIGSNQEITSALQGENPRRINFLKEDGNRVNSRGELVDLWGIPYFFHAVSGSEMEIRSAGPDRIMYTADDLVTK